MIGIEFIICHDCDKEFRKGTGHLMTCECGSKPICNRCYLKGKREGYIKDTNFGMNEMAKTIKDSYK